jgi:hypothetical protein
MVAGAIDTATFGETSLSDAVALPESVASLAWAVIVASWASLDDVIVAV